MFKVFVILAISAYCGSADAAKLPPFVTPCKRNDPNLRECATKEGRKILPQILEGVPDLKLPNMKPLKLPEVNMNVGDSLKIKLTDIDIYGLDDNNLEYFNVDLDRGKISARIGFAKVNLQSQYDINGRLLVLPITGQGPANITFVDAVYDFEANLKASPRKGREYLKIRDAKITYTSKREYYVLRNLFNGDQRLGDQMNKFLDENWQEVSKEIGPAVTEVITSIATIISNAFFNRVPLDNLLPV